MRVVEKKSGYAALLSRARRVLAAGRRAVEAVRTRTYWKLGEAMASHIAAQGGKAGYAHNTVHRLSEDLGINKTQLYYSLEFYKSYPKFPARGNLSWTSYKALLSVNDPAKRKALSKQAAANVWSSRELLRAIKRVRNKKQTTKQLKRLVGKRGRIGCFKKVTWNGRPALDLGFSCYRVVKESVRGARQNSFTYLAALERVVDGDTLWVNVVLKGSLGIRQKLRLRGIDTPETKTRAGKAAKAFLEDYFRAAGELVICTSKSDKYDRYLADVYVGDVYLNQFLIDEGLAAQV